MLSYLKQVWDNKHLILQALVNRFFSPPDIKELANERLKICARCPFNSANYIEPTYPEAAITKKMNVPYKHCMKCGCALGLKPYAKQSTCPMGYWGPK